MLLPAVAVEAAALSRFKMGTKAWKKLICKQQIQDQAGIVMAPGRVQDWTTKASGLVSFPQSSLCYCSHRSSITGLDGLWFWPIRAFLMLHLFPPYISWLLLNPKPSRRVKFRTSISALFRYSHTHTRSWMDVTFITHISGLSFFSIEMWAVFWESASCLQETMLLKCCQLLHWNTIPSDRQEKQFLTYLPWICQRLAPVSVVCVRQESAFLYSNQLGKS